MGGRSERPDLSSSCRTILLAFALCTPTQACPGGRTASSVCAYFRFALLETERTQGPGRCSRSPVMGPVLGQCAVIPSDEPSRSISQRKRLYRRRRLPRTVAGNCSPGGGSVRAFGAKTQPN